MTPRKFFPFHSPVLEFPFGGVTPLLELTIKDEITFVMYYAPWCTRSMAVRWEFHKAAKFMQNRVKFVAINCWWNEGECRQKYKFMSYPVLYVYHTILDGYQYSGVHTAEHFVKFLEDILYPLTYLHDGKEMQKFVSLNDNAVIGYFDFNSSPQPPGYLQFYYASMRSVEKDPLQVLKFGVITNPFLANELMGTKNGAVVMVKHRHIFNCPLEKNFTSSEIVKWAFKLRQQPLVKILSPSGIKSLHLSTEIRKGATVIMFYIHNPLFDANQHYQMLREVALEYAKCSDVESFNEIISASFSHRISSMKKMQETVKLCQDSHFLRPHQQDNVSLHPYQYHSFPMTPSDDSLGIDFVSSISPVCRCCVSVLYKEFLQGHVSHNVCEVCYTHNLNDGDCRTPPQSCPGALGYQLPDNMYSILRNKCLQFSPNYLPDQRKSLCCRQVQNHLFSPPSSVPSSSTSSNTTSRESIASTQDTFAKQTINRRPSRDPFIEGVLKDGVQRLCNRLNFQLSQGVPLDTYLSPDTLQPIKAANFTGLSCRTNRTVRFYAMDIINHSVFAERLGVNATELVRTKKPVLLIIDEEDEKSYILKKPFTKSFIAEFIVNYTSGDIKREILSAHSGRSDSNIINRQDRFPEDSNKSKEANSESNEPPETEDFPPTTPNFVTVTEVTSQTFQQLVINTSSDVLLLYYAPWCGFCASFAHIYLSLARYFQQASNLLFSRINGESEDLPWEYTADTYPTLLFFPSGRKQDSVVFSEELPKSLPNLIRFVLHHATHSVRLRTNTAHRCTTPCITTNLQNAVNRISILDKQLKRLKLRLSRLEGFVFRSNLLNASSRDIPKTTPVQGKNSLHALRSHWGQQVRKKQRQKQICHKLVLLLQRTRESLDKVELINFMKRNNILLQSIPTN